MVNSKTTPRGSKRPLDEPEQQPSTSPTARRRGDLPAPPGSAGSGGGGGTGGGIQSIVISHPSSSGAPAASGLAGTGQTGAGDASQSGVRSATTSPGVTLQQLQQHLSRTSSANAMGLQMQQPQQQQGQSMTQAGLFPWEFGMPNTLGGHFSPPQGQAFGAGLPMSLPPAPAPGQPQGLGQQHQQSQPQQGGHSSPVAFGSLGLKNVPNFSPSQLASLQALNPSMRSSMAGQQQSPQQQQLPQLSTASRPSGSSGQGDSLLMPPPPSVPQRNSPTVPAMGMFPPLPGWSADSGNSFLAMLQQSGMNPSLQPFAQSLPQQQQQPQSQPHQQPSQPQPQPQRPPSAAGKIVQSTSPTSRTLSAGTRSVDPSPRMGAGTSLAAAGGSSQVSSAGDGEERGSDEDPPAGSASASATSTRPKRGEGSAWKPEETEALFNWVFSSPQNLIEADQRPSRFFLSTPSSIGAPRPRHGIANRWKRLLETQRRLNEYDRWARSQGLEPYVDNKFRVSKQMERARDQGVKIGQLTPFTAMLWYSRGWLEKFNHFIPPEKNDLPPAGTLTPASQSGRVLGEGQGSEDGDDEEDEVMEMMDAPTISSPLRRPQQMHAQSSPRSALASPGRRPSTTLQPPSSSAVHLNSPQPPSARPLDEPPGGSPQQQKNDKMQRAINVALQLVTQDNQNIDPALRKKATDLLSSVLDQASDDFS